MGKRRRVTVAIGAAALLWGAGASFGAGSAVAAPLIDACSEDSDSALVNLSPPPLLADPLCGVTAPVVEAGNAVVAPVQEPVQQVGSLVLGPVSAPAPVPAQPAPAQPPPQAPAGAPAAGPAAVPAPAAPPAAPRFGPFLPADFATGSSRFAYFGSEFYDYARLFAARPGLFGQLPSADLYGHSPDFGIFRGAESAGAAQDVAAAGRAHALPTQGADRVALPVLVAVLMLAAVTAAVVRSWAHGATKA